MRVYQVPNADVGWYRMNCCYTGIAFGTQNRISFADLYEADMQSSHLIREENRDNLYSYCS